MRYVLHVLPLLHIAILTTLLTLLTSTYAHAEDQILLLEVTLNGSVTGLIGQFMMRNGILYANSEELKTFGIRLPEGDDRPILLSRLASNASDIQLDVLAQKIAINVAPAYLGTSELIASGNDTGNIALAPDNYGAVLNYDMLLNKSATASMLSGLIDTRIYSSAGIFSSNALLYAGTLAPASVRLDSTFTHSDPSTLRRYRIGDFITSGLSWSRPVRFGGLQLSTDFDLRPDLVTFPTPSLRGEAIVPSNIDLFIDGVRQYSQAVPPGPFEIRQAPTASGAGAVSLAVTDALGRQSFQTIPFYSSSKLLKAGLASYAIETGRVRQNYGLSSDDYGALAFAASGRYGLTPMLTLEGHTESLAQLKLAGVGALVNVDNVGLLSAAIAVSDSASGSGTQYALGFERSARHLSFSLSKTQASPHYRDIGALQGSPVLPSLYNASIGLSLAQYGAINLAYTAVKNPLSDSVNATPTSTRVVSISYFKSIFNRANFFISGFKNFSDNSTSIALGLVIPFGLRDVIMANSTNNGKLRSQSLQTARAAIVPGDIGWQLQDTEGAFVQRTAEFDYKGSQARANVGISTSNQVASQRAGLRGALVWADQALFTSNWIADSFAIVNTGGIPDLGVFTEHKFSGKTDKNGQLLVTDLRSYDINRIAIDLLDLPLDVQIDNPERSVKPRDRSGAVVAFKTKQSGSAQIILTDAAGQFLPLGATVTVLESGIKAPVGYDGTTYLPELRAHNTLKVALPSGQQCSLAFDFIAVRNSIATLGPLSCQ